MALLPLDHYFLEYWVGKVQYMCLRRLDKHRFDELTWEIGMIRARNCIWCFHILQCSNCQIYTNTRWGIPNSTCFDHKCYKSYISDMARLRPWMPSNEILCSKREWIRTNWVIIEPEICLVDGMLICMIVWRSQQVPLAISLTITLVSTHVNTS